MKRSTVWHPLNTDPDDENRSGPRFWYPLYDLMSLALGIVAYFLGSPLLNKLFPVWFTDDMGIVLIVASLCCLVGIVFPRLGWLELIGLLAIVFMLGGYAGTVAWLAISDSSNAFVVLVLTMAVWLLGPRITKLFVQVTRVHTARKNRGKL